MQTHLNLYQHNHERLRQLRQEATNNALIRQIKKPGWIHLFAGWLRSSPWPERFGLSHAQATPKTAH